MLSGADWARPASCRGVVVGAMPWRGSSRSPLPAAATKSMPDSLARVRSASTYICDLCLLPQPPSMIFARAWSCEGRSNMHACMRIDWEGWTRREGWRCLAGPGQQLPKLISSSAAGGGWGSFEAHLLAQQHAVKDCSSGIRAAQRGDETHAWDSCGPRAPAPPPNRQGLAQSIPMRRHLTLCRLCRRRGRPAAQQGAVGHPVKARVKPLARHSSQRARHSSPSRWARLTRQFTPAMPTLLFAAAATMPARCVPWPLSSVYWLNRAVPGSGWYVTLFWV